MDTFKICNNVEMELEKIADKGLNRDNLETAYKLIDMLKDLKEIEMGESRASYCGSYGGNSGNSYGNSYGSYAGADSYGDSSAARRGGHYVRAHYSRDGADVQPTAESFNEYMESKASYRSNKSGNCKERLMGTVERYMSDFKAQMEDMLRDTECREEKETIQRYLQAIAELSNR